MLISIEPIHIVAVLAAFVIYRCRERPYVPWAATGILLGLVAWSSRPEKVDVGAWDRVGDHQREAFTLLQTLDLEEHARRLFEAGFDSLESLVDASEANFIQAGLTKAHYRHVQRGARAILDRPLLTFTSAPPIADTVVLPDAPPAFIMKPYGMKTAPKRLKAVEARAPPDRPVDKSILLTNSVAAEMRRLRIGTADDAHAASAAPHTTSPSQARVKDSIRQAIAVEKERFAALGADEGGRIPRGQQGEEESSGQNAGDNTGEAQEASSGRIPGGHDGDGPVRRIPGGRVREDQEEATQHNEGQEVSSRRVPGGLDRAEQRTLEKIPSHPEGEGYRHKAIPGATKGERERSSSIPGGRGQPPGLMKKEVPGLVAGGGDPSVAKDTTSFEEFPNTDSDKPKRPRSLVKAKQQIREQREEPKRESSEKDNQGKAPSDTLVILEAMSDLQDTLTCTFDGRFSSLGASVEADKSMIRTESLQEAREADGGRFTLLLKDPLVRLGGMFKRDPPDCVYPNQDPTAPRRNPLETYASMTREERASCEEHHNRLTKILTGHPFDQPAGVEQFQAALKLLFQIKELVVFDNMEDAMEVIRKQAAIKTFVQCAHHIQTPKKTMTDSVRVALMEDNKYDWELFVQAGRMFDAKLGKSLTTKSNVLCDKKPETTVCWDGSLDPEKRKEVPRDSVQETLLGPCDGEGCTPVQGRNVICVVRKCTFLK
ncbi:hypothetical protein DIPPA_30857 [Diplonema papillatum]|nr:hypothetical protein DIPPA_30857 [Diplonema papillatum]